MLGGGGGGGGGGGLVLKAVRLGVRAEMIVSLPYLACVFSERLSLNVLSGARSASPAQAF